jgi:hexosaminidase
LTSVGAWRSAIGFGLDPKLSTAYGPDGRYGGFFTQADIREVVAYAAARHITIVPEIEMPGHAVAALAAYPMYSCSGGGYKTDVAAGVNAGVYCAGKDETFEFLQDVLAEVISLFPGKYIHIGGDEVPKGNWQKCELCQNRIKSEGLKNERELQSYFIRRIEKYINSQGRTLIGWSEIREGGLAQNAALMDWIGGATEGATEGHDVVMSPTACCYFDYYQSQDHSTEPRAIGGYLPVTRVYAFEPVPANLDSKYRAHILGAQGNIWTEYIPSLRQVQYMAFPREAALAEVAWSPKEARNWDDFLSRWQTHTRRLDQLGATYRKGLAWKLGEWTPGQVTAEGSTLEWDVTPRVAAPGKYSLVFNYAQGKNGLDLKGATLLEDGKELVSDAHPGLAASKPRTPYYSFDVTAVKPGARYTVRAKVGASGGTDSRGLIYFELTPPKFQ